MDAKDQPAVSRREAAFAHHQGDRLLERRIGAIGDLVELAAMEFVIKHSCEVLRNPMHAAGANGFDAGLLDCLEHGARLLAARH